MKRIKDWYARHKIKDQICIALIGLSVWSTIVLGIFGFVLSKYLIEKNYKEDFTYNLEISNQITDIQLKNIIENIRNLSFSQSFMNLLSDAEETSGSYFNSEQTRTLERSLSNTISQDMLIGEIVVISSNHKLYCYTSSSGASRNYDSSLPDDADWVKAAEAAKGKEVFFGNNVLKGDDSGYMFSMVKKLIDYRSGEERGYMVVNIRKKLLENAFAEERITKQGQSMMIVNPRADNQIAYFVGKNAEQETIEQEYLDHNVNSKKYVVAEVENEITGWNMVSIIGKYDLTKDSNVLGIMMLIMILAIVFLGVVVARLISARIYEPLNKLENVIEKVGEGDRKITEDFDESEIGNIGTKFKEMVHNNLELREHLLSVQLKERESELLLLQSQINPHFLYNTLDSLYCMAIINENDDMAGMVDALSRTFRLSLNNGNKLILVENEVEHIKAYMEVQNFRYNGRFTLKLAIDENLGSVYILKFILQPFVENAMYHGLEPQVGKGTITVTGKKNGDEILFTVTDDGVGISDLNAVYKGYGVKNVMERIKLYYGSDYGVTFESTPGEGTKVIIRIAAVYTRGEITNEESSNS